MIPRRYSVKATKYKKWFEIIDHKENKSFWMHITDFGIINKHLPKYCTDDARAIFELTQPK